MATELIQIVDENDVPVRGDTMENAWRKGLLHRIVYVMVMSIDGKVLLQMRTPQKETFPNCWDVSAGGHVDEGEDYETAAGRELAEELGLSDLALQEVGYYRGETSFEWRTLKRFNRVYQVVVAEDVHLRLQASEVAEVRWFALDEVKTLIAEHSDQVADGLVGVMSHLYP